MESVIVVTSRANKENILLKLSRDKKLYNLKFYSFLELKKKLFLESDERTLEYVMKKYGVKLGVARVYLENMYFLDERIEDERVQFLLTLREELWENKLIFKNDDLKKMLSHKKVVVYGYDSLSLEQQRILKETGAEVTYYQDEVSEYQPTVYQASTIALEVEFVMIKIAELLDKGQDINKIKIIINDDYLEVVNKYAKFYNITINLDSGDVLYGTMVAQEFLSNYDEMEIEDNIEVLREKYDNINDLIKVINKSAKVLDKEIRKEFIIDDLKRERLRNSFYERAVKVSTIDDNFLDDDYVFLLGFNINYYPKVKKDDDYLSDKIKKLMGIDTSIELNRIVKANLIKKIKAIKNLVITCKLSSMKSVFYPSLLIKELGLDVRDIVLDRSISYSHIYSEILYAIDLDNLDKYNIVGENLGVYRGNLNIKYREYDSSFRGINKEFLKDAIGGELGLNYTNMEMYNECAFKYYLSKILNLNIFANSFKTELGNITHHVLEVGLVKDVDITREIMSYVKEKEILVGAREVFYLEKLDKSLRDILAIIKEQAKHSKFDKYLFESELYVYKDREDINITFKGLIDKVMYTNLDDKEVLMVVDYKTGNTVVNLDMLEYGLNIQLPIYLYLLKKSERFRNAVIGGFYVQRVMPNVPNIEEEKKLIDIKRDSLRLQGYSNSSSEVLEMIDEEYQNSSVIKGLRMKSNGEFYKTAKVLSNKEMEELTEVVEEKIDKCIDNILEGNFVINPKVYKGNNISCQYCNFKDICFMTKSCEVVIGGLDSEVDGRTVSSDNETGE